MTSFMRYFYTAVLLSLLEIPDEINIQAKKLAIIVLVYILKVWEELVEKDKQDDKTSEQSWVDMSEDKSKAVVEFTATKAAVLEKEGRVRVGAETLRKNQHQGSL